jgi:hypothetical protein
MWLTALTILGLLVGLVGAWVGIAWLGVGGYALAYLAGADRRRAKRSWRCARDGSKSTC